MLYVVTGPPTAGKSSWITGHARPRDIVIDLDRIALAFAGPGAADHDHDEIRLKVAHRARYAAINEAERHVDRVDVYLIHTMPGARHRAHYRRLSARLIVVDPGEDVVMQRVRDLRQPGMEQVAARWYAQRRSTRQRDARTVSTRGSRTW